MIMNGRPTLYALTTCIHCRNMKRFLDENGVDYECIFVDSFQGEQRINTLKEMKKHNPRASFPTLVIPPDTVVVGFHPDQIEEALEL